MTDSLKYRAKINAKGLDTTGVTEDHARRMAATLGSHHVFVVEARAATVLTDEEGNQQVALVLTQVEPVPAKQEDAVREFLRALYRQRPEIAGQDVLKGTSDGPTVEDTASQLAALVERDDNDEPTGIWDGDTSAPLAAVPDAKPDDGCPFPGCARVSEHRGKHQDADGNDLGSA